MKKLNSIFAISIIVLLTISTFALISNSNLLNVSTVNAQAVSTVPSSMLQYNWLATQNGYSAHFSSGPAPSTPDVLWTKLLP